MLIVDTHCHVSRDWFEPVENLLFQMDRNDVAYAVLTQIQSEFDNSYQFECVRRYPGRFLNVVRVDEKSPTALDDLARLKERGAHGVRFLTTTRSPGDDPLAIWRRAAALGLPATVLGTSTAAFAADEFAAIVQALPDLTIVIEHLGSFSHPDGEEPPYPLRRKVFALARFPNVYIKIHGLGEFTPRQVPFVEPRPFGPNIPPLLDLAYEAFGPGRMMWGSDYPPVSGREGYRNALRLPMEYLAGKGKENLRQVFGGTALKVFGTP